MEDGKKTIVAMIIWSLIGLLLVISIISCASIRYNDPTGISQCAWDKQEANGKYYLNRFQVTEDLYNHVDVGDEFTLTENTYLYECLTTGKNENN